ncbi:hypothetical protein [Brevibacillus sp. SYSU BS000544]|uniref:hypothetical protein n=1 Tax=Brevibacillus sp. SYSU BS000544 TaxID=3416443 RepID=UPI003CE5288F
MKTLDKLENLLIGEEGLLISLRMGEGFKKELFHEICSLLKQLAEQWAKEVSIPKRAVGIFVDLYPSMESASYLYNESERIEILEAADIIADLIRECCN